MRDLDRALRLEQKWLHTWELGCFVDVGGAEGKRLKIHSKSSMWGDAENANPKSIGFG
jgi:hypothetical protein